MKNGGIAIAAAVGLGLFLWTRRSSAEEVEPFTPGPKGKGRVFGGNRKRRGGSKSEPLELPPELPADFDFGGNKIWISPDCEWVVEGNTFWPPGFDAIEDCTWDTGAPEPSSLEEWLAFEQNSVLCRIDQLLQEGVTDPNDLAYAILSEVSMVCTTIPDDMWGDGLAAWYQNFVERIAPYVEEETGIPFDPGTIGPGTVDRPVTYRNTNIRTWEENGGWVFSWSCIDHSRCPGLALYADGESYPSREDAIAEAKASIDRGYDLGDPRY